MTEAEDRVACICKGRTSERERTALKEEVWAKKSNLMKGRVTHLLMKRALHSSSKLPPFRRATSSTRAHTHTHTPTNNSVPFTSPSERGINEWSDRHGEPMGPLPREGKTHSAVLILKQQPSPFACSIFFPLALLTHSPPLFSPHILISHDPCLISSFSIYFHLRLLIHLGVFFSSSSFSLFDCSAFVCCLLSFLLTLKPSHRFSAPPQ